MAYKPIAQPYVVLWNYESWREGMNEELSSWLRENASGQVNLFCPDHPKAIIVTLDDDQRDLEIRRFDTTICCMFENVQDALRFKLTWCGNE